MWQEIAEQKLDGFIIRTYVAPETDNPRDYFMVEGRNQLGLSESMPEIVDAIHEERLEWFRVMVTASKCGVELGSDFLGGCCYESFEDFLGCGYWSDMVETAITEAREIIEELKK